MCCISFLISSQLHQTKLIRSVLRAAFGKVIAANIVVRGSDATWSYEGAGSKAGKQQHIASAVEELTMVC
jgi:hypothetical protein